MKDTKEQLLEIKLLMWEFLDVLAEDKLPHLSLVNDIEIRLWAYDFEVRKSAGKLTQEEQDAIGSH